MIGCFARAEVYESSRSSSCNWTAKETGEGCHGDKNPLRVYFPPSFSPQVCILSTCCIFLFHSRSPSLHLAVFVLLSLVFLRLPLSALCLFLCPHVSLRLFLLMSSFVPIFLLVSLSLSLSPFFHPCGPHLLSSRRGREKQRRERNANFIATATECRRRDRKRKREREGKCHSSEEMRWPLHCVWKCVCVCLRKDQDDSLSDIWCIFPPLCLAPLPSKWYICIYRCAFFVCRGGKC